MVGFNSRFVCMGRGLIRGFWYGRWGLLGDIEGSIPISPGPKLKLAFFEPKFASLHSTIRVDVNVISR